MIEGRSWSNDKHTYLRWRPQADEIGRRSNSIAAVKKSGGETGIKAKRKIVTDFFFFFFNCLEAKVSAS